MRRIPLVIAALILCLPVLASAQEEWMEFKSIEDRFSIPFPGKPAVQTITWPSEYGAVFPGRVYTVQQGASRYSVTVIDYTDAVAIHAKIAKPESFQQDIYAQIDVQASIQWAASKLYRFKPGAKVTYDAWHYINLIEGHQLQLTNADGTKTYVAIYLHENRLYIVDATVPANSPAQGIFQQNLEMLDEKGGGVRYNEIYSNRPPPLPQRGRGGRGGGGGGGRGDGGGGAAGGGGRGQ
jgi:uncharacterized membrane protein YgcG